MSEKRTYKKTILGGRFMWFTNPTDMNDIAGTAEACLGLTRGANINMGDAELRMIEADGQLGAVKGGMRITDIQPSVQLTLLQASKEVMSSLGRFVQDFSVQGTSEYRPKGILEDIDYIDKLVGLGETQDGGIVVIVLENAILNTLPAFDLSDKDEATFPLTFLGTYESADSKKVPFTMTLLDTITNAEAGAVADVVVKDQSFDIKAADTTDEAAIKTSLTVTIDAAIAAVVSYPSYPDAKYEVSLQDGEDNTIADIIGAADGESFDIKYTINTTGFKGSSPHQTFGNIKVSVTA